MFYWCFCHYNKYDNRALKLTCWTWCLIMHSLLISCMVSWVNTQMKFYISKRTCIILYIILCKPNWTYMQMYNNYPFLQLPCPKRYVLLSIISRIRWNSSVLNSLSVTPNTLVLLFIRSNMSVSHGSYWRFQTLECSFKRFRKYFKTYTS